MKSPDNMWSVELHAQVKRDRCEEDCKFDRSQYRQEVATMSFMSIGYYPRLPASTYLNLPRRLSS